ncbi:hypothetical protein Zmor_019765 [Zophobas morio]|uniref:Gustatory receptor n=1 Tax=Zophobas morio TaxID=2755281 RepID=A0AA38M965_9CUCU|nr:hypothetical protein Zmor_019765 [Zophobas morio]
MKKCYGCILVTAKLITYVCAVENNSLMKEYFNNTLISQKIGYTFVASTLMLHFSLTVIFSAFLNVNHWKILFTNLENFDSRIKSSRNAKMSFSKALIYCLILQQIMFLLLSFYPLYTGTVMFKSSFWRSFNTNLSIEMCYEIAVVSLINIISDVIKRRYKVLNTKTVEVLKGPKVIQELENVVECYQILGETAATFNAIFGYQILIIVFHSGVQLTHSLNVGFVTHVVEETSSEFAYIFNLFCVMIVMVSA